MLILGALAIAAAAMTMLLRNAARRAGR
jgi:hypothetical protein